VVTNNGDFVGATCPGPNCTLRAAIAAANAPGNVITFQSGLASPIVLSAAPGLGQLAINGNSNLTITGPGPTALAVDGGGAVRVFDIGFSSAATVSMSGLTIQNGLSAGGANMFGLGGGIRVLSGSTLNLSNVNVSNNTAGGQTSGGTFSDGGDGGGIANLGTLTATNVTVNHNTAAAGNGALPNFGGSGGGIANRGTLTLTNVTVSTNTAQAGAGANARPGVGGGIVNLTGSVTLNNVTVNRNTAAASADPGAGGGIWNGLSPATISVQNSIVANSTPAGGNCSGTAITALGANLSSDGSCSGFTLSSQNPLLGPLQLNPPSPAPPTPGNNLTHALLQGSPAQNAGSNATCAATDERNVARPQGPACDLGAFESQGPLCILADINCDSIVDIRDYGIWRQNFGQTNCGNPADLNADCLVDIQDYGIWRQNFGHTGP
jgi:hypothetical protein